MTNDVKNQLYTILAVRDIVVFPGSVVPLFVGRKQSLKAIEHAMSHDDVELLCVVQKDSEKEDITSRDLYRFGTSMRILQAVKLPDGTMKVLAEGIQRVKVSRVSQDKKANLFMASGHPIVTQNKEAANIKALSKVLQDKFAEFAQSTDHLSLDLVANLANISSVEEYTDLISSHLPVSVKSKQSLLESIDLDQRIHLILSLMEREKEWFHKEKEVIDKVRDEITKEQKAYFIRKKLEVMQGELEALDEHGAGHEISELEKKANLSGLKPEIRTKLLNEISKLKMMSPMSAESAVIRNYLDTVFSVKWGKENEINTNLDAAMKVLDTEHFGLEKVKERVIESLAVSLRVSQVKAPIICFVGPPGVGKTSLGQSIAKAMGRSFVRVALGGVREDSEIRGHRKTFVGAMPGQIIRALGRSDSMNPLIMLDEIDKMGMDFRGDPASALLEVLDPEQNDKFVDHYIEFETDLSKALFITTANTLDIPPALLDRMEVIELSGYTQEEKFRICKDHLVGKCLEQNGLKASELAFEDETIHQIIKTYTAEAGVRSLERKLSKICRKVVRERHGKKISKQKVIKKSQLQKYLKSPPHQHLVVGKSAKVGVVNGLAWTAVGGELLHIESLLIPGKGELIYTGSLGEVMEESIETAHSLVRSFAKKFKIKKALLDKHDLHVHVPEGATPKDGPSAGIAMATALLSVLTNQKVRHDVAMTGEVTLRGNVLAIGGLKEKILAAIRAGATEVIIPKENQKDLKDFEQDIQGKVVVHCVAKIDEVFKLVFEQANEK
ncbi:endopeptidase La [Gammaproteobacteria bacterium]|nr:endopeptidase La [Gammaproteobacteria bacterium]